MISDLILTFVVVMAMSALLTWVVIYTQSTPWKEAVKERLVIEDAWFNETGIGIYIYNYGDVDVVIKRVYITPGPPLPVWEGEVLVRHGRSVEITISDFTWETGQAYEIRVETGRGSEFEILVKAPPE